MGGKCGALASSLGILVALGTPALADEPDQRDGNGGLAPTYLIDGGALPFIWGALGARLALDAYGTPRETPLVFDPTEGGAEKSNWEVPGWSITAIGGVSAAAMLAGGDDARYFHVKGLAEALSTGVLVTGLIKVTFGRHRPDWDADRNTDSSRRSFPSGHATQALAIATYSILYLHGHVFDKNKSLTLGEAMSYGAIALGGAALAGERVYHNRHHLTDVTIGGLLGATASTLFYVYQERRYRDDKASHLQLTGGPTSGGASIGITTVW